MAAVDLSRHNLGNMWFAAFGLSFCCYLMVHKSLVNGDVLNISTVPDLKNEDCKSICYTEECMSIANSLLSNMDQNVDPCDDFYSFSCGGYMAKREKANTASVIRTVEDDILLAVKDVIESSEEINSPGSAAQKLKTVYDSCMGPGSSESVVSTIQEFLHELEIPKWPHLDPDFTFRNTSLEAILGRLTSQEDHTFVEFSKKYEEEIPLIRHFEIDPQKPTYDTDTDIGKIKDLVTTILQDAGMNPEDIYQTWEEFMSLEEAIRKLAKNKKEARIFCEEMNTTTETIVNCREEHMNNESMFCKILDSVITNGNLGSIFSRDEVYIYCHNAYYMNELPGLLGSYDHRTLAHYMIIRFFLKNSKDMDFTIRKRWNNIFNDTKSDKMGELDRWKFCTSWIVKNMAIPLGFMYVTSKNDSVNEADAIVAELSDAIIKILEIQDWIRDEIKTRLIQIIGNIELELTEKVKLLTNETRVNEMYKNFHPTPKNFIRNVLRNKKFIFNMMTLMEDAVRINRYDSIFGVGAFTRDYSDVKFGIDLTFGFLLPPFYTNKAPKLFNLAAIEEILAHEFGHVFYMTLLSGEKVDNLTQLAFQEKRQCLIDQYSNYKMKHIGKYDRGNVTIFENFPDNMAIHVAEKIVEKLLRNITEDIFALPGLPYSAGELFYIHFVQPWCEVTGVEMETLYSQSTYSASRYRVTGVLQNSKRFSEVFNCPSKSFMNPEKKCSVFD